MGKKECITKIMEEALRRHPGMTQQTQQKLIRSLKDKGGAWEPHLELMVIHEQWKQMFFNIHGI